VTAADSDYASKVQIAQSARSELLARGRPEAVKSIQDLIRECDAALTICHKASFNEKLILSNGLSISPIQANGNDQASQSRSLRDAVYAIDNEKDLSSFISSYAPNVPPRASEIKYEKHPVSCQSRMNSCY